MNSSLSRRSRHSRHRSHASSEASAATFNFNVRQQNTDANRRPSDITLQALPSVAVYELNPLKTRDLKVVSSSSYIRPDDEFSDSDSDSGTSDSEKSEVERYVTEENTKYW